MSHLNDISSELNLFFALLKEGNTQQVLNRLVVLEPLLSEHIEYIDCSHYRLPA